MDSIEDAVERLKQLQDGRIFLCNNTTEEECLG